MLKQHESVMCLERNDQIAAKSQEELIKFLEDTHAKYDPSARKPAGEGKGHPENPTPRLVA